MTKEMPPEDPAENGDGSSRELEPQKGPDAVPETAATPPQPTHGTPFFLRGPGMPETNPSVAPPPSPPKQVFGEGPNLRDGDPKPEDMSWGDYFYRRRSVLKPRHQEFARLLFLGKTNAEIAETLGYTNTTVTLLSQQTDIRNEVARLQEKAFERTIGERLKECGPAAMDVIEEVLLAPDTKKQLKKDTAVWVIEKLTGKAKQEIDVSSSTLTSFYELLDSQRQSGHPKDVTPVLPGDMDAAAQKEGGSRTSPSSEAPAEGEAPGAENLQAQPVAAPVAPVLSRTARWVKENL